ncbi:MAG: DsbA family protein [Vicinamibacteria bacterium]|nr:DsbA family protein [Vicinamibacteria bacterium]
MKHFWALLAISFSATACNQASATVEASAAGKPDDSQVAAKIGARSFSNADLDTRIKNEMSTLRARADAAEAQIKSQLDDLQRQVQEQEYNLRKKALSEVLFDMEAQSKGVDRNTLVEQEVTSKGSQVLPHEIDALWETVKSGARGATKEQMRSQLQTMVVQRKTESELARYQLALFKKYHVSFVGLQPARKTVAVPSDAPVLGPKDAPITIVEFTDYQCPYCQQAQQYVDRVMEVYKDKVRLVYQEFPLDFHAQAMPAGVAARCAGEQGKFWEMHTSMLSAPGAFDKTDLESRARNLGIDTTRFNTCVASGRFDPVIQKAIENGRSVGVSGTPTFFLNGRTFSGAQPFEVFERMIEEELAMAPGNRAGN